MTELHLGQILFLMVDLVLGLCLRQCQFWSVCVVLDLGLLLCLVLRFVIEVELDFV